MSNTHSLMRVDEAVTELETAMHAIAAVKSLVELEGRAEGMNKLLTVDRLEMVALMTVLSSRLELDVENVKHELGLAMDSQRQERRAGLVPPLPVHQAAEGRTQ